MKISILYICLFFFGIKGFTQPPLNVEENFDNNNRLWKVKSTKNYDLKIENGVYTFDIHNQWGYDDVFIQYFHVDLSQDFIIEAKLRIVSGIEDGELGFFMGSGYQNWKATYISGNCHYKTEYRENSYTETNDIPWQIDSNIVKPTGNFNVIKFHKIDSVVNMYINNIKVSTQAFQNSEWFAVGFLVPKTMKVEVDHIHIYQYGDANINLVKNPIKGFVKENLGPNINGEFSDRAPVISPDGRTLYFIKQDYSEIKDESQEVYYSTLNDDGNWAEAKNIGKPINNKAPNNVVSVSADGNTLIVTNTYKPDGSIKGAGISTSQKTDEGWTLPKDVIIDDYYNYAKYTEFCLSSNKKVLIMTISRNPNSKKQALYVSFKKESSYSSPLYMGDVINSKGEETTPFLAPDDKTLYFSSNGHLGYGGFDIFVSRRLDDSWTNWSTPENLGPEFNTRESDLFFSTSAKGDYAYLSSNQNSLGKDDIFRIKLVEGAKPTPVTLIKGKVLNAKTKEPIFAEIIYQNLNTSEEVGRASTNPNTGDYQIVLPSGVMYGFMAQKVNFYPVSNYVDATALKEYNEINYDLLLNPIEVGESIRLNNLFFDTDKSELKSTSFPELERLVDFMKANPKIVIEISGHTDNVGAAAYNQTLSDERAKSVLNYLISKGIHAKRLTSKGFGLSKPVASNDTEEGKAINRRVEMKILEK